MTTVFVDSGAWIALSDPRESLHRHALQLYSSLPRDTRLLTSNYVVAETITWLRYHLDNRSAVAFRAGIDCDVSRGTLRVVWVDEDVHEAGWAIFAGYDDQVLSMTDCTSAVIARRERADYVFSFDRDFSMLGFEVRPGP